ncbi:MAG TPA: ParB/RepB/Spo0J family partition protein [Fimbriimonadaceae bacterium]|nr:ParB/RepB/Spo0J family partition protein [Fimbriimonadaceae bacterium]
MRRALGKGLSQLIGEQFDDAPTSVAIEAIEANRWQPRSVFRDQALEELAASIREVGVLQPLVVRPIHEDRYELIAGERRLRASKLAGLTHVPIIVRSTSDQSALEIALIENIQREDIGPLECARAYRQLMSEFGLTQEQVADKVGKARTSVANTVRLLRLPPKIQDGLETGRITEGHARAILAFDREEVQLAVYEQALSKGMTVRDVERLATRKPRKPAKQPAVAEADPNWTALEENLSVHLGAQVKIQRADVGGRLVIEFYSEDELGGIVERMGLK